MASAAGAHRRERGGGLLVSLFVFAWRGCSWRGAACIARCVTGMTRQRLTCEQQRRTGPTNNDRQCTPNRQRSATSPTQCQTSVAGRVVSLASVGRARPSGAVVSDATNPALGSQATTGPTRPPARRRVPPAPFPRLTMVASVWSRFDRAWCAAAAGAHTRREDGGCRARRARQQTHTQREYDSTRTTEQHKKHMEQDEEEG